MKAPAPISLVRLTVKPATKYVGPLPPTVPCEPYKARLTLGACARRWQIGNSEKGYQNPSERARFAMKDRHTLCLNCSVGKDREKEWTLEKLSLLTPDGRC